MAAGKRRTRKRTTHWRTRVAECPLPRTPRYRSRLPALPTCIGELSSVEIDTGYVPGNLREADRDRAWPPSDLQDAVRATEQWKHEGAREANARRSRREYEPSAGQR